MKPYEAAAQGIARTFQNLALYANKLARIAWAVLRRGKDLPLQECRWRRKS